MAEELEIKKQLEHINLAYIDRKGAVKTIKFSEEFDMWSCEKKIEYLIALSSALNVAAETAYKEREEMALKTDQVMELNENAALKASQSTTLMEQVLTQTNAEKQALNDRIAELKKEIRQKDHMITQLEAQQQASQK